MLNLFISRKSINYNNTLKKIEFKNFFKIQFNKYNFADVAKKQEASVKGKSFD